MIYIFTIIICLFFVWYYDIQGKTKYKQVSFYILLIWLITISGFQYMVGVDVMAYTYDYERYSSRLPLDLFFKDAENNRLQPGWVFMVWLFKQVTGNFFFLKLTHAIFLNVSIFHFFKRESKSEFLCIFFYIISSYLVMNFNVLRQSMAVAFELYAISYINNEKYLKSILFIFLAYMFHDSALLLIILPFFKFLKFNKVTLLIVAICFFVTIYAFYVIDFEGFLYQFLIRGDLDNSTTSVAWGYMNDERLGASGKVFKYSGQMMMTTFIIIYYIYKKKDMFWGGLSILYLVVMMASVLFPILWRFRLYFDFSFYLLLASVLVELKSNRRLLIPLRKVIVYSLIVLFVYFPIRDYFNVNSSGLRNINQYYPYHSIFDPVIEKRY